eukprot:6393910-Alexandrium_andersonii.AAC.1
MAVWQARRSGPPPGGHRKEATTGKTPRAWTSSGRGGETTSGQHTREGGKQRRTAQGKPHASRRQRGS